MTYNIDPMVCQHDGRIGMSIPPICMQCGARLKNAVRGPYIGIDELQLEERVAELEKQVRLLDDRDTPTRQSVEDHHTEESDFGSSSARSRT